VIFTTIQKFQPEEGNVYEELTDRRNVVAIADEAHRTQYGFAARTVDEKDALGNITGKRVVYGFAKYLRDALPNATYLGFTGTPIETTDINTPAVFGNYVDVYDIAQAVEDGATKKIYHESRLARVSLCDEGKKLIAELDEELEQDELTERDPEGQGQVDADGGPGRRGGTHSECSAGHCGALRTTPGSVCGQGHDRVHVAAHCGKSVC
jgi:type I restriction enzyme R subunit